MVVVDAVEHHIVGQAGLAVHVGRQAVLRVEELRVRPEGPGGAGHRDHQPLEVAVEGQRHLGDLLALDDAAGVGAVGLQRRRLLHDRHRFRQVAHLEGEIHAHRRVHVDLHVLADGLPEARQLRLDPVHAVFEVGEGVVAAGVGSRAPADAGLHLGHGYRRAGDAGARGVGDGAEERPLDRLRARGRGKKEDGQGQAQRQERAGAAYDGERCHGRLLRRLRVEAARKKIRGNSM